MNIVICTGAGLLVLAIGITVIVGCLWVVVRILDSLPAMPAWTEWIGVVLVCVMVATAVLILGHDIGCKMIHLTHHG